MTGALYLKTDKNYKTFVYNCTVLAFDQSANEVKIRYIVPPAMTKTAITKWVSNDEIKLYTY